MNEDYKDMLPGIFPALPLATSLLPAAGAAGSIVPETFAQVLGGASPAQTQTDPPLLNEFASHYGVSDPKAPLNRAGLPQAVTSGEFTVHVRRSGGTDGSQIINEEHQVRVNWPDEHDGTSLQDVAASLNGISG